MGLRSRFDAHSEYLLQISKSIDLKKKEVDDVLGGAESWKNAAKTDGAPFDDTYVVLTHQAMHAIVPIASNMIPL